MGKLNSPRLRCQAKGSTISIEGPPPLRGDRPGSAVRCGHEPLRQIAVRIAEPHRDHITRVVFNEDDFKRARRGWANDRNTGLQFTELQPTPSLPFARCTVVAICDNASEDVVGDRRTDATATPLDLVAHLTPNRRPLRRRF